ncbi:MAG: hypothetical protein DRJ11_04190 [Candidatus Aminicenantes bacterium]|nr:DUF465 domain-containing protein [Candidatus Aminicenantes bacterium]RLE03483.1 MAG: hypothetical protein DRJ11_04190 [Candidatus Aminicenantes bacterium]
MDEGRLKELLLAESEEFRRAYEEHRRLEEELKKLVQKEYLTPEEEVKEKQLKKRKLALKDQMYLMMEDYRKRILPR